MAKYALWAVLESKPGKEKEVEQSRKRAWPSWKNCDWLAVSPPNGWPALMSPVRTPGSLAVVPRELTHLSLSCPRSKPAVVHGSKETIEQTITTLCIFFIQKSFPLRMYKGADTPFVRAESVGQ